jgi:hypothetical protein
MTTSSDHVDPSPQPDAAGTEKLPQEAQATVAEIKADNAALRINEQVAEIQAEAVEEQAKLLNQVTEEVLEELQEREQQGEQA